MYRGRVKGRRSRSPVRSTGTIGPRHLLIGTPNRFVGIHVATAPSLPRCAYNNENAFSAARNAATTAFIERAFTLGYFIPTMIRLMGGEPPGASEAIAKALQWVRLGYLRHAATLAAWLAALMALYLMGRHGG
jgi:hypothetical protein